MVRTLSVAALIFVITTVQGAEKRPALRHEIQQDLFAIRVQPSMVQLQLDEIHTKRKSPALAALFSLLLPGLGEYYADGWSGTGKVFSGVEGLLWLGFAATDIYGNSLRENALSFAASHASVNFSGKDDQFLIDVGNFPTTQEYNEVRLRDREPERLYDVNAGYGWRWDSEANRVLYRERRESAENMLNNRKFIVSAIIVNHLVSAINAARLAIRFNNDLGHQTGELELKAKVLGGIAYPHGMMLTLQKSF